jgi:hypothetical protein
MVGMDKISSSKMKSLMKFNIFWFYWTILHKTMQSTKRQTTWNLMFFVLCRTSKHESCNFTQNHAKHKITSHMKFYLFVLCKTSKHESYNSTQNHTKHKMTSHMKFDLFVLCRTWKHESWDSTHNHAKHKMTSHMKFEVFCSMFRTSKHEILRFYTKPCKAQNDKPHEVWCFLFDV